MNELEARLGRKEKGVVRKIKYIVLENKRAGTENEKVKHGNRKEEMSVLLKKGKIVIGLVVVIVKLIVHIPALPG